MLTILCHPRSKSSLLSCHLKNYKGEVFNIESLDVETLEINPLSPNILRCVSPQKYAHQYFALPSGQAYLEKLGDILGPQDTIKVFYHQINNCGKIMRFIKQKSTRNIEIVRRNRFEAILSNILAARVGWAKHVENEIQLSQKVKISLGEFLWYKVNIVDNVIVGQKRLPLQFRYTFEGLDLKVVQSQNPEWFEAQPSFVYEEQNTLQYLHLIENLDELRGWAQDLGLEPTT